MTDKERITAMVSPNIATAMRVAAAQQRMYISEFVEKAISREINSLEKNSDHQDSDINQAK